MTDDHPAWPYRLGQALLVFASIATVILAAGVAVRSAGVSVGGAGMFVSPHTPPPPATIFCASRSSAVESPR